MKFKSIRRAIRRGHIKLIPKRLPKLGEAMKDIPVDMYRLSNRGNLIKIG